MSYSPRDSDVESILPRTNLSVCDPHLVIPRHSYSKVVEDACYVFINPDGMLYGACYLSILSLFLVH